VFLIKEYGWYIKMKKKIFVISIFTMLLLLFIATVMPTQAEDVLPAHDGPIIVFVYGPSKALKGARVTATSSSNSYSNVLHSFGCFGYFKFTIPGDITYTMQITPLNQAHYAISRKNMRVNSMPFLPKLGFMMVTRK